MRYFSYKKLVRDKIVDSMKKNGQKPVGVRVLKEQEFIEELIKKLSEEVEELKDFKNSEALKEELVDIIEVTRYLQKALKLTDNEINKLIKIKRKKGGAFDRKLYLEKVGTPTDSEWFQYFLDNSDRYPEVKE